MISNRQTGGLGDRSLPPPPRDLGQANPELNASRQSFRMAMGNNVCESLVVFSLRLFKFGQTTFLGQIQGFFYQGRPFTQKFMLWLSHLKEN